MLSLFFDKYNKTFDNMEFLKNLFDFIKMLFSKTSETSTGNVSIETIEPIEVKEESSVEEDEILDDIVTEETVDDIIDDSATEEIEDDEDITEEYVLKPVEQPELLCSSKYKNVVVFLLPGHCSSTPGKKSPDKSLYEWKYNREIVSRIEAEFDKLGIAHWNPHPEDDFVYKTKGNCKSLDSRDLILRKNRINEKYSALKTEGKKVFMLEVHVNAAGSGEWYNATGWCCYTTVGLNNSDKLADCLYDAAEEILIPLGKKLRTDKSDGDRDQESNFYVIKNSNCVCTLTENFFMDNKSDVEFLLSEQGKKAITDVHIQGAIKYIEKYC